MTDVCIVEVSPDQRCKQHSEPIDTTSNRHPSAMVNEEDDDADDEDDDDQDDSDFEGRFASRISLNTSSQPLDLDGSIVVGGTVQRRGSICSSCGTYTSGSSCDGHHHDDESCTSSRSTRGFSPTRESSGDEIDDSLPYPGFRPVTFKYLSQTSHPRDWCLRLVTNPYPFFTCVYCLRYKLFDAC